MTIRVEGQKLFPLEYLMALGLESGARRAGTSCNIRYAVYEHFGALVSVNKVAAANYIQHGCMLVCNFQCV